MNNEGANLNTNLHAVILAAGMGTRLNEITSSPKVLLEVAGKTLLEWHLEGLVGAGVKSISVVVGYRNQEINDFLGASRFADLVEVVPNPDPAVYGNGYSMLLGLEWADDDVLVIDGDLLCDGRIYESLMSRVGSSLLPFGEASPEDEECTKLLVDEHRRIHAMVDKRLCTEEELTRYQFAGEALGILFFTDDDRKALIEICKRFFSVPENLLLNWEHILNIMIKDYPLLASPVESRPWIEIDTPEDYEQARVLFAE